MRRKCCKEAPPGPVIGACGVERCWGGFQAWPPGEAKGDLWKKTGDEGLTIFGACFRCDDVDWAVKAEALCDGMLVEKFSYLVGRLKP